MSISAINRGGTTTVVGGTGGGGSQYFANIRNRNGVNAVQVFLERDDASDDWTLEGVQRNTAPVQADIDITGGSGGTLSLDLTSSIASGAAGNDWNLNVMQRFRGETGENVQPYVDVYFTPAGVQRAFRVTLNSSYAAGAAGHDVQLQIGIGAFGFAELDTNHLKLSIEATSTIQQLIDVINASTYATAVAFTDVNTSEQLTGGSQDLAGVFGTQTEGVAGAFFHDGVTKIHQAYLDLLINDSGHGIRLTLLSTFAEGAAGNNWSFTTAYRSGATLVVQAPNNILQITFQVNETLADTVDFINAHSNNTFFTASLLPGTDGTVVLMNQIFSYDSEGGSFHDGVTPTPTYYEDPVPAVQARVRLFEPHSGSVINIYLDSDTAEGAAGNDWDINLSVGSSFLNELHSGTRTLTLEIEAGQPLNNLIGNLASLDGVHAELASGSGTANFASDVSLAAIAGSQTHSISGDILTIDFHSGADAVAGVVDSPLYVTLDTPQRQLILRTDPGDRFQDIVQAFDDVTALANVASWTGANSVLPIGIIGTVIAFTGGEDAESANARVNVTDQEVELRYDSSDTIAQIYAALNAITGVSVGYFPNADTTLNPQSPPFSVGFEFALFTPGGGISEEYTTFLSNDDGEPSLRLTIDRPDASQWTFETTARRVDHVQATREILGNGNDFITLTMPEAIAAGAAGNDWRIDVNPRGRGTPAVANVQASLRITSFEDSAVYIDVTLVAGGDQTGAGGNDFRIRYRGGRSYLVFQAAPIITINYGAAVTMGQIANSLDAYANLNATLTGDGSTVFNSADNDGEFSFSGGVDAVPAVPWQAAVTAVQPYIDVYNQAPNQGNQGIRYYLDAARAAGADGNSWQLQIAFVTTGFAITTEYQDDEDRVSLIFNSNQSPTLQNLIDDGNNAGSVFDRVEALPGTDTSATFVQANDTFYFRDQSLGPIGGRFHDGVSAQAELQDQAIEATVNSTSRLITILADRDDDQLPAIRDGINSSAGLSGAAAVNNDSSTDTLDAGLFAVPFPSNLASFSGGVNLQDLALSLIVADQRAHLLYDPETDTLAQIETAIIDGGITVTRLLDFDADELAEARTFTRQFRVTRVYAESELHATIFGNIMVDFINNPFRAPDQEGREDLKIAIDPVGLYHVLVYRYHGTAPTGSWATYTHANYQGVHEYDPANPSVGYFYYNSRLKHWFVARAYTHIFGSSTIRYEEYNGPSHWVGHYRDQATALNHVDANGELAFTGSEVQVVSNFVAGTDPYTRRTWERVQ